MQPQTTNHKRQTKQKGFTIIEAVVSTGIFAIAVVSILGVYLSVLRLDNQTHAERLLQQNARFILEQLSKSIRNGSVDYSQYPGGSAATTIDKLWIMNEANESEFIFLSGTDLKLQKGANTTNLNSNEVKVTKLLLLLTPVGNPFTPAKTHNQQPNFTVVLELTSNYGQGSGRETRLNLQTTIASREYPSR